MIFLPSNGKNLILFILISKNIRVVYENGESSLVRVVTAEKQIDIHRLQKSFLRIFWLEK